MKKYLLASLVLCSIGMQAQNHTIKGKINGLNENDSVYLAQYLGKSLFYNDTAVVKSDGYFTFEGKPYELGGKYAIVTPGPKLLEVLLDSENLLFESDQENLDFNMNVIESKNNQIFYDYKRFLGQKNTERGPWDIIAKDSLSDEKEVKNAREEIGKLTEEVINYQKRIIGENKEILVGKMINMSMDIIVPDAPKTTEDERQWRYKYYRNHYWDNVDLTDPRLVREQAFHRVLEKYLSTVLPQIPDTIVAEGGKLLEKVAANYDMYKYTLHQMTYLTETSKIMCMDRAFVAIVNKYYKTGKADWLDEEKLAKIIEGSDKKSKTLCGEVAPNIILPDVTGEEWINMHDIDAEYLVVAIWEPGCGHCKKEMPKLQEVYKQFKSKGLEVVAVNNELENEDWIKFVEEKELDWINISDNPEINNSENARQLILDGTTTLNSLNFRAMYNITSTPQIYLLDKNKEILAKQLNSEQLEGMLENLLNNPNDLPIKEIKVIPDE
jgi:thiol-disulfide isomerase/thioredoxin